MLFNSLDFALFLPIVFAVYWSMRRLRAQNAVILVASYIFYGWWDYRFLALIFLSTLIDFQIGRRLDCTDDARHRKMLLITSLVANLGMLAFFKYCNFFIENFNGAFTLFGESPNLRYLNIILPVGISFYTFQTLSYTIDVYRRKLAPTHSFVQFAAFVSFFPQLVAGPIERGTNLLPQFIRHRHFDSAAAADGLRQMLWGFFKKMVIADNCAVYVNLIFEQPETQSGSTLVLGAVLFAFQIYGDFSGYSDIAIGLARLFGFQLMQNFAYPYFSRDIAEFWRRWHISLSTWFRDYVYIPLGGNQGGLGMKVRNVFIIFIVSGFWHGANWTFIIWGALNALFFLPLLLMSRNRRYLDVAGFGRRLPSLREVLSIAATFGLTTFAWIFFRAESLPKALVYLAGIFDRSLFSLPQMTDAAGVLITVFFIALLTVVEWRGRTGLHALEQIALVKSRPMRWSVYFGLIFFIAMYMQTGESPFIYFQF